MNTLQKIEAAFGEKFTPKVVIYGEHEFYSAVQKRKVTSLIPSELNEIQAKCEEFGLRVGIDFYSNEFSIFGNYGHK